ncbi:rod shape-determining protein MreD [Heyndrickxia shackletonii]|uniref:Rod shape-determining protein MreD n=1 Tax=Heyndrickxia shackletonii TaxID=157838 RepID=A0A0Q3WXB3_9BACI|nr:rod shape-determining protein MreD [Heyndrickxia shackletonii]KQL53403.1 rod shape-determining protein MreD [Heyndrickxia shackletonii]MBB2480630.1 rod shape-determining protein MreD [Bacillus sp. APMAM]NEY99973.1 rod shape-determining protein MreD [Heyndrickxia shackletonii]RTZ56084.1 rod shape-determining protein MreD [Bacillus sp. SAJ1]
MKRIVLPLILSICFILESLYVEFFPSGIFGINKIFVPHFLLIVLIVMGIYYVRNRTILYAFIFGLLFDAFYTGILGVYLFVFPLIVYITSSLMKVLQANLFVAAIVMLVDVAIAEFIVYGLNILILKTTMSAIDFINVRLIPTLILNLVFYIIIFYPLRKCLVRLKKEVLDE